MNIRTAKVEATAGPSDPLGSPARSTGTPPKFTYASGSRPLDGFTIKRGIGRGGFGEVYFAVSDGGKEVALKLIRRNFDVELRGAAQCLNLKHPNLVGLYDIRSDDHDDRWVVMEHVTGDCLEQVIAANQLGMPLGELHAWMQGIVAGVAYLHECGIVHRDLKPGNIFSDNGLVKIGDYGLSKFISCSRRSGQTESVGTVHYMAPEIANGRYGKEIDIYALGVMLYEMLTGRVPFEGESVGEVLMKHLTAQPDVTPLDEPYRSIVRRALAKDPRVRYASATELLADLPSAPLAASRAHLQPKVSPLRDPRVEPPVSQEPVLAVEVAAVGAAANPSAGETVPAAGSEEPLLRWVRDKLSQFGSAWNNQFNTAAKVVFVVAACWLVLQTSVILVPSLVVLALAYLVYRACWWLGRMPSDLSGTALPPATAGPTPSQPPATPAGPPVTEPPGKSARRRRWRQQADSPCQPLKSVREKIGELCGSMVVGALVCLVVSLVMLLLRGVETTAEQYAWLALASMLGTWAILTAGKIWEGGDTEPAVRRFGMLLAGLLVGTASYGVQQHFWVDLPHEFSAQPLFAGSLEAPSAFASVAEPFAPGSLMTYLSYFGFLFLLVRWWRLADPMRSVRFSLWATAVAVTWAGALYLLWPFPANWAPFPQPWGFMCAATMAVAVQLSSPWTNQQRRTVTQTA
ncbi:MAG: protein kinase [Planctomycetales bacterium]|nr:protein kinase [Planctomycetales bacterium]NIM08170.1 protein kinase [Planctomycetales bacterium]NIN07667.1 protein kinase [Planctomycetales bacterium]NIN76784.1 protein kinase [Planctomycetales bacterium]NIO33989.1 protein kinase [Planctomycetales bacterium]